MGHYAYLQIATAENTTGNCTYIDHHDLNNNPSAILIITHNWSPPRRSNIYNNHHTGVWYDTSRRQWTIFNQDRETMPPGVAFNISIILNRPSWALIHRATLENIRQNWTYIDHPFTNRRPNTALFITPNYIGSNVTGIYHNHAVGVWYDRAVEKWAVFNQDQAEMPAGTAFNIEILSGETYGSFSEHVLVHVADNTNIDGNSTYINFDESNGLPGVSLIATQNYNPRGASSGVYNNHAIGLWYSAKRQKWAIYNEDMSSMPEGAAFNIRE